VTIALVSDARIRRLNRTYRNADYVTDVLSFPASPSGGGHDAGYLGDIAIATGRAARQARDCGHSLAVELRVLALHGLLHLLGFDHERDAGEMAAAERRLRRRGGLASGLIEREHGR
jgi:probable rRNA maturation factor